MDLSKELKFKFIQNSSKQNTVSNRNSPRRSQFSSYSTNYYNRENKYQSQNKIMRKSEDIHFNNQ